MNDTRTQATIIGARWLNNRRVMRMSMLAARKFRARGNMVYTARAVKLAREASHAAVRAHRELDEREAAIFRDVAALELHGEFAALNFPELRTLLVDEKRDALLEAAQKAGKKP